MTDSLPRELDPLKKLPHWVAWEMRVDKDKSGRLTKPPIDPRTGKGAKADDAQTWGTYEEALTRAITNARKQGLQVGQNHGVGFELGVEPCGIAGIDLDHVIQEDGTLKPFALDIVRTMDSYTELSPSGRGLHILFKLTVPLSEIGSRNKNVELGLEMYDHRRYLTVTGEVFEGVKPIAERTEELRQVYGKYMVEREKLKPSSPVEVSFPQRVSQNDSHFSEFSRRPSRELDDRELWELMFRNSRNGREIWWLYSGSVSGYRTTDQDGTTHDDHSGADLALCNHLAYWTGRDAGRMDRMFRQSGLMRGKWDDKHGGQTYGAKTIEKAISGTKETYDDKILNSRTKPKPDSRSGQTQRMKVREQPVEETEIRYISAYLDAGLEVDIGRVQKYSSRKTGYGNLDAKTSLYPGMYVVGAVSSLGKTTFCGQMADQLSRAGEHVLYFCLEQTELELVTKGLSRLTAQEDMTLAVSSIEIRSGRITDSVRRAIATYKKIAKHEAIIECNFMTTVETIVGIIQGYMRRTGVRPIVFIDYLQLIRPSDKKQTTKDAVDEHLRALKMLQMENDLVVILISSLNRQNYLTTIDYESFKESGGIEFTADVVWGLQLSVMNDEVFNTDKKLKEKRELVRQAKRANPRRIELLCLKNRYGIANYRCIFDYYAKYDLFLPVEEQEDLESDTFGGNTNENKRVKF